MSLRGVMGPGSKASSPVRRASFWLAAGFALLVSHDAVFTAQMGPGRELAHALRGATHAYWGIASAILLAAAATGLAIWVARIALLRRMATQGPPDSPRGGQGARSWARRMRGHWWRLFVLVAIAFAIQENVEHFATHGHVIGLGALLGPEYPLALPVLAVVTGLASFVTALIREHEADLLRRIAAARAPVRPLRRIGPMRPEPARIGQGAPMSNHRALRAPPLAFLHA